MRHLNFVLDVGESKAGDVITTDGVFLTIQVRSIGIEVVKFDASIMGGTRYDVRSTRHE